MPRHRNASRASRFHEQAAAFIGVADVARAESLARCSQLEFGLNDKCTQPMDGMPPMRLANRSRGLVISILELNQAVLQEPRRRHDRGVTAAINHRLCRRRCMEVCKWLISP